MAAQARLLLAATAVAPRLATQARIGRRAAAVRGPGPGPCNDCRSGM